MSIEITLRQAKKLVEFFGGQDSEVTVINHEKGLLAYCADHTDEGGAYLGETIVEDSNSFDDTQLIHAKEPCSGAASQPETVSNELSNNPVQQNELVDVEPVAIYNQINEALKEPK